MSRLVLTKTATPSIPASNKSAIYVHDVDTRVKQIDSNGFINTLNNGGLYESNLLINGGFTVQQRVLASVTAIPGASTTTRAGQVSDRWAVTTGNTTTVLWTQVDTSGANEVNLENRYYGKITQNTNAAKFILSQFIIASDMGHLRGKQVRLSCKIKQFVGANANYRLGLLQLNASGTVDVCPAFSSAIGAAGVEPTWGTNIAAIAPDAVPATENGTISGVALTIASTAGWVRSSCCFTVPLTAKNLIFVLYRDTLGAASDACGVAEMQLTQGPDIVSWVSPNLATELYKCQRFFSKSFPLTVVPAASIAVATGGYGATFILGKAGSGTVLGSQIPIQFANTMWKTPTVTLFTPITTGASVYRHSGVTPAVQGATAVAANSTTDQRCHVTATNEATANGVIGDLVSVHYTAEAEFIT